MAQRTRIGREFCIEGKFYAFDSSTIDLCMSIFKWANFRSTKSGIKLHTQLDIVTQIPKMVHISEACVHDSTQWVLLNMSHKPDIYLFVATGT